jgi:hypothetical protein
MPDDAAFAGGGSPLAKLRGFLGERPAATGPAGTAVEVCELCGAPIAAEHPHLVDVTARQVLCACRPCFLLFDNSGATASRFRAVPDRYLHAPDLALTAEQWERLQIPVAIAFFFHHSTQGQAVAFYPGPAGATECLLGLDTWDELTRANPLLAGMRPDVEALLVHRRPEAFDSFIVPITACYELVGRIRMHWKGFQGGEEAWREIDAFFAGLRARSSLPAAPPPASSASSAPSGSSGSWPAVQETAGAAESES